MIELGPSPDKKKKKKKLKLKNQYRADYDPSNLSFLGSSFLLPANNPVEIRVGSEESAAKSQPRASQTNPPKIKEATLSRAVFHLNLA